MLDSSAETVTPHAKLVVEKISRPEQTPHVFRPRLLDLLSFSLSSRASTILVGRAGTGKTALAIDFAGKCGRGACWYKVDAPEADMRLFFQYLVASLQRVWPGFGESTLIRTILASEQPDVPLLAESFAYELAEQEGDPLLIVLEDLHLVCDAGWVVPFFQRVLPLLPSHAHMLITSRTMPPAPLWRMRSKQTLLVIDEDALAFTRSEATQLFENHGLSREQASIAVDHTHGRAAALAAFAMSLNSLENGGINPSERLGTLTPIPT